MTARMNGEYRNTLLHAVKKLPRDKFGRISYPDFERLDRQARSDLKAGIISALDYVNVRCLLGEAVNLPRRPSLSEEAAHERRQLGYAA